VEIVAAVVVVFLVWFAVVAAACAYVIVRAPSLHTPERLAGAGERGSRASGVLVTGLGRPTAGALVMFSGWSLTIIVGWILGWVAKKVEVHVDHPFFRWWQDHHIGGTWSHVWWKLTNIGSPTNTQILTVAGAVLFAVIYQRRARWWVPSLVIVLGYLAEKYGQIILKKVVDRGHPPTTLGTWPSGGCARLLIVYGLIIFFVLYRYARHNKRAWAAGWSLLTVLLSVQAYARINNLEHWLTDVIGGIVFGLMLLAMIITAYRVIESAPPRRVHRVRSPLAGAAAPLAR
jgi:hypothetical protein